MKIIQALKTIKANKAKVADLTNKIRNNSAILSHQTSPYGNAGDATIVVSGWLDSIRQILRDNEVLTRRIHLTNNTVEVTIEIGGEQITKTIDEWLTRRANNVDMQQLAYQALTDRGLKEEFVNTPTGERVPVTIVRHYDAKARDEILSVLMSEKAVIDSQLEVINATTDLME